VTADGRIGLVLVSHVAGIADGVHPVTCGMTITSAPATAFQSVAADTRVLNCSIGAD